MGRIYTPLKVFHFKGKVDSLPAEVEEVLPPVHVRIKPTNVCTHRCSYCAYRAEGLQLGEEMNERDVIPREKMLEIVEDLVGMGVRAVTFSGGGEPFCYPYLAEAARRLAEGGVRIAALTNGSRLVGAAAEVFAERATWVRVSIDGWDGPSYARFRGVGEAEFGKVLENLRRFKGLGGSDGRCRVGASIIVTRENAGHILELIDRLAATGIDSVKVSPCIVSNDGAENNAYHEPIFGEVKGQVAEARQRYGGDGFEIFDAYHRQLESFAKDYTWCPYLQILPVIGADLGVYACQDKAYTEAGLLGWIREGRFRDFWMDGKAKFFRIDPSRVCGHHCVADGKNRMVLDYLEADAEHGCFV